MKKVISKKGFSLVELIIALSILIIMTGVAILYLGDVLYKAKVAKAATDIEILIEALTLNDAENPTDILDSGFPGAVAGSTISGDSVTERDTLAKLVGIYLLSLPNDPWGNGYRVNSYAGWVKSLGEDLNLSGTTKYDRDVAGYFLPENLFLAKVRAEDLNDNAVLDTGDEVRMYFSKSVRCNAKLAAAHVNTIKGTPQLDSSVDNSDSSVAGEGSEIVQTAFTTLTGTFDYRDIMAFGPGQTRAYAAHSRGGVTPADLLKAGVTANVTQNTSLNTPANTANQKNGEFVRPTDSLYFLSCFTRDLIFTVSNAAVTGMHLDIGYDVYIPSGYTTEGYNYKYAYTIWESTKGYASYKTTSEKAKIYLQTQNPNSARRTLVWKSIVD